MSSCGVSRSVPKLPIWQTLLWVLASVWFLFVFLTNAVPLLDALGIGELKSKTRYAHFIKFSSLALLIPLACLYIFKRDSFRDLPLVRFFFPLSDKKITILLRSLTALFFLNGVWGGWLRHQALETRAFDLGIFAQALWNTVHGDFLHSSLKDGICLLGDHFAPFLILISPIYAAFPNPVTLLTLQALATAACIPLIYTVGRQASLPKGDALLFAFLFFLYGPARNTLRADFHPEVLVEPLMIAAFIFLRAGRRLLFLLSLILVVSAKENLSGVVFILGFYAFFFEKRRWLGLIIMAASAVYLLAITQIVIPALSGEPYLYSGFYRSAVSGSAWVILHQLLGPGAWEYLLKLLAPVLFLPILHPPTFILMLPVLTQNLLSENGVTRSFNYHYTVGLTPFVFIGAVYGWKFLISRFSWADARKPIAVIALTACALLAYGPSEYFYSWKSAKKTTPLTAEIQRQMLAIPTQASLLTHANLIPQAVHRKEVYQFEFNATPTKADSLRRLKPDYVVFFEPFWEPNSEPMGEVLPLREDLGYELISSAGGSFFVYRSRKLSLHAEEIRSRPQ